MTHTETSQVPRRDVLQQALLLEPFGVACVSTSRLPNRRSSTKVRSRVRACEFSTYVRQRQLK